MLSAYWMLYHMIIDSFHSDMNSIHHLMIVSVIYFILHTNKFIVYLRDCFQDSVGRAASYCKINFCRGSLQILLEEVTWRLTYRLLRSDYIHFSNHTRLSQQTNAGRSPSDLLGVTIISLFILRG